jgi:hypothetical protein
MKTLELIIFRTACYNEKTSYGKSESNKSCRQNPYLQSWFCSFLAHHSPKQAMDIARNGPKFPWVPKLEAFTVTNGT